MTVPLAILLSEGKPVDLDATLFIQLAIFLLMFLLLRSLLFRPVIRLIEIRRKATEGNRSEADLFEAEARQLSADVERQLGAIRVQASKERDQLVDGAKQQARAAVSKARDDVRSVLEKAKEETASKAEQVRGSLRSEIGALADTLAARVLGRPL